jgi:hypothetical protein
MTMASRRARTAARHEGGKLALEHDGHSGGWALCVSRLAKPTGRDSAVEPAKRTTVVATGSHSRPSIARTG